MDAQQFIIPQGTDGKFRLTIADYDMHSGHFAVVIVYGYRRETLHIDKADMLSDEQGRFYFTFPTADIIGQVTALCCWDISDADIPGGTRTDTDRQIIAFVAPTANPRLLCLPAEEPHPVSYERIGQANVGTDYIRLLDYYGQPLPTADGHHIYANRSTINNYNPDMETTEGYKLRQTGEEVQQILDKSTQQVQVTVSDGTLIITEE